MTGSEFVVMMFLVLSNGGQMPLDAFAFNYQSQCIDAATELVESGTLEESLQEAGFNEEEVVGLTCQFVIR